MPRKRLGIAEAPRRQFGDLAEQLANELKSDHPSGQPMIWEQEFPTGAIRVVVLWDKWERISHQDRTAAILRAYQLAGSDYQEQITLASGLTPLEAHAAGMLPYQIIPARRKEDPVTLEECRQALIDEGASTLLGPDKPQLWFATEEDAEAGRQRLIKRLPRSEPVWVITQDVGRVEDFLPEQEA